MDPSLQTNFPLEQWLIPPFFPEHGVFAECADEETARAAPSKIQNRMTSPPNFAPWLRDSGGMSTTSLFRRPLRHRTA